MKEAEEEKYGEPIGANYIAWKAVEKHVQKKTARTGETGYIQSDDRSEE